MSAMSEPKFTYDDVTNNRVKKKEVVSFLQKNAPDELLQKYNLKGEVKEIAKLQKKQMLAGALKAYNKLRVDAANAQEDAEDDDSTGSTADSAPAAAAPAAAAADEAPAMQSMGGKKATETSPLVAKDGDADEKKSGGFCGCC